MGSGRSLVLGVLLVTSVAHADDDPRRSAKEAIAHAKELHKAGKFHEALNELMRAYALDPQKDLLYGIAQLHVKLNNCPDAITFFRRYLAAKPDATSAEKARQGILACENQPAVDPVTPKEPVKPPPTHPITTQQPPPLPPPRRRDPSPWYTDKLGDGLVGGGLIVGAIGFVEYLAARSAFADADAATAYQERVDGYADARDKRKLAAILGAGGAVLAISGVVRYSTRRRMLDRDVAVILDPNGSGLVTWMGTW